MERHGLDRHGASAPTRTASAPGRRRPGRAAPGRRRAWSGRQLVRRPWTGRTWSGRRPGAARSWSGRAGRRPGWTRILNVAGTGEGLRASSRPRWWSPPAAAVVGAARRPDRRAASAAVVIVLVRTDGRRSARAAPAATGGPPGWPCSSRVTEGFAIHVRVRRGGHAISLSEIPMVLGLLAVDPVTARPARVARRRGRHDRLAPPARRQAGLQHGAVGRPGDRRRAGLRRARRRDRAVGPTDGPDLGTGSPPTRR